MIEEADMGRLDKLDVPNEPLPKVDNDDSEEERPKSKVEQKLDAIPPPPTDQSGLQEHWEWEDPAQMKIPPAEPDSESIVSRYKWSLI